MNRLSLAVADLLDRFALGVGAVRWQAMPEVGGSVARAGLLTLRRGRVARGEALLDRVIDLPLGRGLGQFGAVGRLSARAASGLPGVAAGGLAAGVLTPGGFTPGGFTLHLAFGVHCGKRTRRQLRARERNILRARPLTRLPDVLGVPHGFAVALPGVANRIGIPACNGLA